MSAGESAHRLAAAGESAVAPGKSLKLRDLNRSVFPALYPDYFEVCGFYRR